MYIYIYDIDILLFIVYGVQCSALISKVLGGSKAFTGCSLAHSAGCTGRMAVAVPGFCYKMMVLVVKWYGFLKHLNYCSGDFHMSWVQDLSASISKVLEEEYGLWGRAGTAVWICLFQTCPMTCENPWNNPIKIYQIFSDSGELLEKAWLPWKRCVWRRQLKKLGFSFVVCQFCFMITLSAAAGFRYETLGIGETYQADLHF